MNRLTTILTCVVILLMTGFAFAQQQPAPLPRLGINLAGLSDWNTELPLIDVFRLSRHWISQKKGEPWGRGPELVLDAHGWVVSLAPDCWAETPLCTIEGGHYPSGKYTVLFEGDGMIEFGGAAKVTARDAGRIVIDVDSTHGPIWLRIKTVNKENPLRDIRVIMPGFEKTWRDNPWHPAFLRRWKGFASLRFMDMMDTNGSEVAEWSDRPKVDDATWTTHGLPIDLMCDLANRLKIDPWFCMPHRADDDYVRHFAKQVKELLDPNLKAYVEYSNEVWNGQFAQNKWAAKQGQALGLAKKPWEAAWKYTGHRSIQIFEIWEKEFGGTDRLVRVLATQAANPYVSGQVLESNKAFRHADALAIAPYFSMNVTQDKADEVAALGVDGILDRAEEKSLPQAIEWMKAQKAVAEKHRLQLIGYEGGQHMVGVRGGEDNEQLTQLFQAANRHPRMGKLYTQYYDAWADAGGDLMCTFSSVGRWSKWGSWGLMEYADENPADSPKFLATLRWAKSHTQDVNLKD